MNSILRKKAEIEQEIAHLEDKLVLLEELLEYDDMDEGIPIVTSKPRKKEIQKKTEIVQREEPSPWKVSSRSTSVNEHGQTVETIEEII